MELYVLSSFCGFECKFDIEYVDVRENGGCIIERLREDIVKITRLRCEEWLIESGTEEFFHDKVQWV